MQRLTVNHSTNLYLRALRFSTIRMRSRPGAEGISADLTAARQHLAAANEAVELALEERMASVAEVEYLDQRVDDPVLQLARDQRAACGGKLDDPRYVKLFPRQPTAALKPEGGDAQKRFVSHIVKTLREDDDYVGFRDRADEIVARQQALEAAEAARDERYVAEDGARARRRVARAAAAKVYNHAYHRLQIAFPDDPALVESFFMALSSKSGASQVSEPVVDDDGVIEDGEN